MSELDQDWIQRDLDGGAIWSESEVPLDVVAELRRGPEGYDTAAFIESEYFFEDEDLDLDDDYR
jgi:hypothetical protein